MSWKERREENEFEREANELEREERVNYKSQYADGALCLYLQLNPCLICV